MDTDIDENGWVLTDCWSSPSSYVCYCGYRERQQQIDELTKELSKMQGECDSLKQKLRHAGPKVTISLLPSMVMLG